MRTRPLGKTGLSVSELGFGSLFASKLGLGFEHSRQAVHRAVDLGITYFDTAPAYADSEVVLGAILREIEAPLVVSTKLGGRPQPFDPLDAAALIHSAEESLRLLGREVIDVMFVHEPDRPLQYAWWTDPDAVSGPVLEALDTLKRRGLVRFTGLGGTTTTEMAHLVRSGQFDVLLTAFNCSALFREAEAELLPAARELRMGVVLGSTLQQGALGRRYDDVVHRKPAWLSRARQQQLLAFYKLLDESGLGIVEMALRWAVGRRDASTILIGPKTCEQVEQSVAAAERGPLSADVVARLDSIAAMVPFRPFEEPMILPLNRPRDYYGPGMANIGAGAPVGKM
jgi:aryl-alcohol dehydrogenase-like predicted oxidoreductase